MFKFGMGDKVYCKYTTAWFKDVEPEDVMYEIIQQVAYHEEDGLYIDYQIRPVTVDGLCPFPHNDGTSYTFTQVGCYYCGKMGNGYVVDENDIYKIYKPLSISLPSGAKMVFP